MPASTPFLGLYKPGGGSSGLITPDEVVDIDRLNTNADLIDAFAKSYGPATERNHQFYGPAASLSGVTGMKLGDTYQESDGNKVLWKYDGTNWVTNESGLILVRPTSVSGTGVTIGADGSVIFAANTPEVLVNNCFSSRYKRHRIIVTQDVASADTDLYFALRNAGAAAGAGQAFWVRVETNLATGPTASRATAQNHVGGGRVGISGAMTTYEVHNASQAQRKFVTGETLDSGVVHRTFGGQINVLTACDGLAIGTQGAPTMTGSFKIYAYA